jgi:hypothetical protein
MSHEVIPKKSSRSNLRKRALPNDDCEEEDDSIVVNSSEFLSMVREEQKLRVKKNGIVVDTSAAAANIANAADANVKNKSKLSKKSIESTMKNQFSSQSSTDNYGSVSHDKILDEYIADKLGLKNDIK